MLNITTIINEVISENAQEEKLSKGTTLELYNEYVRASYTISEPKFDYQEIIKTVRPSLPVESPRFEEPSDSQMQLAFELITRNFNEESPLLAIAEVMDKNSMSDLIGNLLAIDDTPTDGQKNMMSYLESFAKEHSDQMIEVINKFEEENPNWRYSKREMSDLIGKLKPMQEYILRNCPSKTELNEIKTLYYRATGKQWDNRWDAYVTKKNVVQLKTMYTAFCEVETAMYQGYNDAEEHKRDTWFETKESGNYNGWNETTIGGAGFEKSSKAKEQERQADRRRTHKERWNKIKAQAK